MKITGFRCVAANPKDIPSHAFGNNVAFACPDCGHPVLAIMLENQQGSDSDHPTECQKCHKKYWLSIDSSQETTLRLWISN